MNIISFEEWRLKQGRQLEALGQVECCTTCQGTGEGLNHPCTSCYGVGFFDVDPSTGEPSPTTKLNPRVFALTVASEVQQWCAWTNDDPVTVMNILFDGDCPITAVEILQEAPSGAWYAY